MKSLLNRIKSRKEFVFTSPASPRKLLSRSTSLASTVLGALVGRSFPSTPVVVLFCLRCSISDSNEPKTRWSCMVRSLLGGVGPVIFSWSPGKGFCPVGLPTTSFVVAKKLTWLGHSSSRWSSHPHSLEHSEHAREPEIYKNSEFLELKYFMNT